MHVLLITYNRYWSKNTACIDILTYVFSKSYSMNSELTTEVERCRAWHRQRNGRQYRTPLNGSLEGAKGTLALQLSVLKTNYWLFKFSIGHRGVSPSARSNKTKITFPIDLIGSHPKSYLRAQRKCLQYSTTIPECRLVFTAEWLCVSALSGGPKLDHHS